MARVTIVMRTFERPVLLARAVASVTRQSYADWNLVIVNNGGNRVDVDGVASAARVGQSKGEITVLHLPAPVGMEKATNEVLRTTQSDFFAVHDDDDTWSPEFLSVMVGRMDEDRDAVAAVSGLTKVHETMRGDRVWPVREEPFWLVPGRLTFRGMIGNNTFPPIAALFRRSVLDRIGMFDESLPVLGDWDFNLRAVRAGVFLFEPRTLARYHVRTPESDRAAANSIIEGADLHRSVKLQLQDRWIPEMIDGVSKGLLSIQAQTSETIDEVLLRGVPSDTDLDPVAVANHTANILQARSMPRRIWRGIRHPGHAARAVRRIFRG